MWLSFTESEILGLTKSKSISSDGNYITIKEVVIRDEHNKAVIKNKGKQPTRDRTLRIPEYMKGLIDKVETDRLVTISGTALSKRFDRLIKKNGLPHMTFHDLRHVNASMMSVLNIPDKYAQERGGRKTDHIMKSVYQQTFSSERTSVDDRSDDYMMDVIRTDPAAQRYRSKYKNWLELFDRNDTASSRKEFDRFVCCFFMLFFMFF
jgi:integrase